MSEMAYYRYVRTWVFDAYHEILAKRVSLKGRAVKIEKVIDYVKKNGLFEEEEIKNTLLYLFYVKGEIDLVPGKNIAIEDANGNGFEYMLLRRN